MLMLMAYGPGEVAVPCRFFRDQQEADAFTSQWMIPRFVRPRPFQGRSIWRVVDEVEAEENGFYDAMFTRYYGGCGAALAFEVKEVPVDQAFLTWDLD